MELVRAAITERDGSVEFHYSNLGQGAMSHVAEAGVNDKLEGEVKLQVKGLTVKTLVAKSKIPKNLGILSIDAEGMGAEVSFSTNFELCIIHCILVMLSYSYSLEISPTSILALYGFLLLGGYEFWDLYSLK